MTNRFNKTIIKIALKSFTIASFLMVYSCDPDETQVVTQLDNLVIADEFNVEGTPDASLWSFEVGDGTAQGIPGWGNNELQYYTDRPENVTVENGVLVITAQQEVFEGSNYTSGRLVTKDLFEQQYGRFEARIRLPYGKGIWPAFWLLGSDCDENPWPQCGEIDIMEYLGDSPTVVFGTAHGPNFSGEDSISKEYELENSRFDTQFHVFGIEWGPNYINYYVDGDLYQTITPDTVNEETDGAGQWVFNRPFYIILNIAVGGNLPGSPNAQTVFPQRMFVDYVRVYN